jgi:hypothetical protein
MQGRLDFVLTEIASELEREPLNTNAEAVDDPQPATQDNQSDDKLDSCLDGSNGTRITTSFQNEPEAEMSADSSDEFTLIHDIDAAPPAEAIGVVHQAESVEVDVLADAFDSHEVEGSSAGQHDIPLIEACLPAEGPEAGLPTEAILVAVLPDSSAESAARGATLALASPFPWNAVVLGARHEQATQPRSAATRSRRWAAITVVTAAAIAAAAAGSGFATLETRSGKGSPGRSAEQPASLMQEMWRLRAESAFH